MESEEGQGGEGERGERRKNIRVNVCWCILILRCTSKIHTPAKFCWYAPENTYTCSVQISLAHIISSSIKLCEAYLLLLLYINRKDMTRVQN
jgi:hypothetical protein